MSASWTLLHLRNCEQCMKHFCRAFEGIHVICLYNNPATSTKTTVWQLLWTSGREQKTCCSAMARRHLLHQHRSFLPQYKSLVTRGLQGIKTLSFMYISLKHQRCFGFIISWKHKSCKCFRGACFIEKVLQFCMWNSGKQNLGAEKKRGH